MQGHYKRPPSANATCRDAYQPDLALCGEKALAVNSYNRTSKVVSFNDEDVWYTPYARSPSPRTKSSHIVYSSIVKGYKSPEQIGSSGDFDEDAYYMPANSPINLENEAVDLDRRSPERPKSRSVMSSQRQVSGRKGLRKGRPTSALAEFRTETSLSDAM